MATRTLTTAMRAWRVGDPAGQFPIFSGEGAALEGGRWNENGQRAIYASQSYSTAMLECLAHFSGELPSNQHFFEIDIPAGITYEVVTKDSPPGWTDQTVARAHGAEWLRELCSAILIVPSFVAREECNVLINPAHPQFGLIRAGLETPVIWDERLLPLPPPRPSVRKPRRRSKRKE